MKLKELKNQTNDLTNFEMFKRRQRYIKLSTLFKKIKKVFEKKNGLLANAKKPSVFLHIKIKSIF